MKPQTFRQKPLAIKAFRFTAEVKAQLMLLEPSSGLGSMVAVTEEALRGEQPGFFKRAIGYFDQKTQTMTYSTYGKTGREMPLGLGRWLIYEKDGESTRLVLTDAEFRKQYEPVLAPLAV